MKMTMMVCGLALGFTAMLLPQMANAQSEQDKTFLTMAAQANQNEIALSKVAEEKASSPAVKSFAHKMVTDHTKLGEETKPFAEKWGLTPPTGPDAEHQRELDQLNGMSGKDFDKEYINQMVTDHDNAVEAFTNEANTTQDAKFKPVVMKGKAVVTEHKKLADGLQKRMM